MSTTTISSFIRGREFKFLREVSNPPPFPNIKLFDIKDKDFVGVEYPGKDRQAQPRKWWEKALEAGKQEGVVLDAPLRIQPRGHGKSNVLAAVVHPEPKQPIPDKVWLDETADIDTKLLLRIQPRKKKT